jgi:hypothetical protein
VPRTGRAAWRRHTVYSEEIELDSLGHIDRVVSDRCIEWATQCYPKTKSPLNRFIQPAIETVLSAIQFALMPPRQATESPYLGWLLELLTFEF